MILETLVVGKQQTNCYLLACEASRQALVVDPGDDAPAIEQVLAAHDLCLQQIVLTHFHFDHMLAAPELMRRTGAPLAMHRAGVKLLADPPAVFRFFAPDVPRDLVVSQPLQHGDLLTIGELAVSVRHTPGHSPDGISLYVAAEGVLFCGDALFREGIGRTDFPNSDHYRLLQSIRERILSLPDATRLLPGHGPESTVGHEKRHNPWLN
jgi:glyoxylase-like metal-dependent hydrolase (beta-lactamase superfamily II)